jgi:hypothetical protein
MLVLEYNKVQKLFMVEKEQTVKDILWKLLY